VAQKDEMPPPKRIRERRVEFGLKIDRDALKDIASSSLARFVTLPNSTHSFLDLMP